MHWAHQEMALADFGDQRLNQRARVLLETLGEKPSLSIPAACGGWSETLAAYRFFNHESATFAEVLHPHRQATLERMRQHPVVLMLQDTSELDYSSQPTIRGLGRTRMPKGYGAHLHPLLAVTPEGLSLGVVAAKFWSRPATETPPPPSRKQRPIEEKESFRWIEMYHQASQLAGEIPQTQVITVADREADLYELFYAYHQRSGPKAEWLVRAAQDRSLLADDPARRKLWSRTSTSPSLGEIEFDLPATAKRPARRVRQTLKAQQVTLRAPYRKGKSLPHITVFAVLAEEIEPPAGVEPLCWLLLTSLPVTSFEEAVRIMRYYLRRWHIEIFFHILKNGCKVEQRQLTDFDRLSPCLAFYLMIAWRVLFATHLGRTCPDLPCDLLLDTQEWQAVYLVTQRKAPPPKPPSMAEMIEMVASLGGYLGRKHDGPPGPKSIWIGLQRARDFALALDALHSIAPPTYV